VAALKDPNGDARVRIAAALMRIDPDNPELVLVFVGGLKHPEDEVRGLACTSLGDLGARARGARNHLVEVVGFDVNESIKKKALDALKKIGGD
jgi:hypothetical protein